MKYFKVVVIFILILKTSILANDFQHMKSFEASFIQTITNPSGNIVKYSGLIYIQEPNKIKWQYQDPIEKLVFIDKNLVTIIEPELEQAIITKIDQEINILNLLKDANKISKNNYVSQYNSIKYSLKLIEGKLTQIAYQDELENNIVISFKNIKQNHQIPVEIFKFSIPLDFDIIKK